MYERMNELKLKLTLTYNMCLLTMEDTYKRRQVKSPSDDTQRAAAQDGDRNVLTSFLEPGRFLLRILLFKLLFNFRMSSRGFKCVNKYTCGFPSVQRAAHLEAAGNERLCGNRSWPVLMRILGIKKKKKRSGGRGGADREGCTVSSGEE